MIAVVDASVALKWFFNVGTIFPECVPIRASRLGSIFGR